MEIIYKERKSVDIPYPEEKLNVFGWWGRDFL